MPSPVVVSFLSDVETPISLFSKVSQEEPTAFLLESADGDTRLARFSFIGVFPAKTVSFKNGHARVMNHLTGIEQILYFENPLAILEEQFTSEKARFEEAQADAAEFPFCGGWVGYMGYAATQYFDGIAQQEKDPLQVPDGYYGLYDSFIVFDHLYRRISFVSYRLAEEAQTLWQTLLQRIGQGISLKPMYDNITLPDAQIFANVTAPWDEKRYCTVVQEAKALIQEGQLFQIVVAHRFSLPITCDTIDVYRAIQSINPSPYSYYLKFPDFVYVGSSPETFVKCQNGEVILRALAGTRPRGQSAAEDQQLAEELRENAKELSEHRMLVDLGRNDLGRNCVVGSIEVGEIATITRYTHVMHLATELKGQLRPDKTAFDVFKSCFPRGTVSGAPKIRAMQVLSRLEPEQRGIYSGVVGYFDFTGNMDGAIAIRSTLIRDGIAHVQAGAGIVYDSDPVSEYEETRNKAKSILKAIQVANQTAAIAEPVSSKEVKR